MSNASEWNEEKMNKKQQQQKTKQKRSENCNKILIA